MLPISGAGADNTKAFVGARIFDGTGKGVIENGVLVVRDGRIQSIGPSSRMKVPVGAERIDASGKTILPGLINVHGHVGETRGLRTGAEFYSRENVLDQLKLYARYGVTTVFSLGGDQEVGFRIRDEQTMPGFDRARLYIAGPVVAAATPEEARRIVADIAAMKADIVKIRVDDNLGTTSKMSPPVYQAVIDEAHKKGLRVAAHIFYLDDAKSLLRAGVDFLAHSIRDREVDDELISLLKAKDIYLCPTLTREVSTFIYESKPAFFDDPFFLSSNDRQVIGQLQEPTRQRGIRESAAAQRYKIALQVASRNLKALSDAGVRIAFGTDTGPPARFQGYFEHMELELMVKAGLTPMQVLTSATGEAARFMKLSGQIGTLQPGAWADFLILKENPLTDIRNSKTLESVWIAGNPLRN